MNLNQYNELMTELNFFDNSVGINATTLQDEETLRDILEEFNYEPLGYKETSNSKGFEFKKGNTVYSIQEYKEGLKVYEVI